MNQNKLKRSFELLWMAAIGLFIAVLLYPVSSRLTRKFGLALFFVVWFGFIFLFWRRRVLRFSLLGISLLFTAFLCWPKNKQPSVDVLRSDYVTGLQRYDGVKYFWGGESPRGIDCSGLVRRGMIDSSFLRGLLTLDPGRVRHAISLWWHDTTASVLGEAHDGLTTHVLDTPSLNQLDHSQILPGDLAVTKSGGHIMAYLGENRWIEADPGAGHVITVLVPTTGNGWFDTPMKIVRWSVLSK